MSSQIFREFKKTAESHSSKPALFFREYKQLTSLSYGQVCAKAIQLGAFLVLRNIKANDTVVLLIGNQPEWPIAFMAVQYAGAVAVPLDIKLHPQELIRLLAHCKAKAVLYSQKLPAQAREAIEGLESVEAILVAGEKSFTQTSDNVASGKIDVALRAAEVAALFYTSGTIEDPKAVMLTENNLLSNARSIQQLGLVREDDVFVSFLPLHHTYSFMVTCLLPLLSGAQVSYPASLNSDDLREAILATGVSIVVGVPLFFSLFHQGIKRQLKKRFGVFSGLMNAMAACCGWTRAISHANPGKYFFSEIHRAFGSRLRFLVSGGAKLDEEIQRDFFRWGFTLIEGYGLTETSPIATLNPLGKQKIGSVGKAIPQVEIKIFNPDEQGRGEVVIKGPNVMRGYYALPEATKDALKDGWLYTQDIGYLDKDGYLFITGRNDDLIVLSSGKKVNPEEIEKEYGKTPYVKEVCVVSARKAAAQEQEEQLTAIVVADEDYCRLKGVVNIEEKIRWELDNLTQQVSAYKRVKGFVIVKDALPRTALGKIMRYQVRRQYFETPQAVKAAAEEACEEDYSSLPPPVCRKVLDYFSNRLKRPVRLSDHIELDLGLDSLARIEILLELQKLLAIEVPDYVAIELFQTYTIRDLMLKIKPYLPKEVKDGQEESLTWSEIIAQEPPQETMRSLCIRPTVIDSVFSFIVYCLFRAFWLFFYRLEVKGEPFPRKGPYIVFANHTSYFDPIVVAVSMPARAFSQTFFLGFKQIFTLGLLKRMSRSVRFIPIDIAFDLVNTLKACAYLLRSAKNICMFPEGQRAPLGELVKFKKGIGILAKELNVPLVPVYIQGTYEAWSRYRKLPTLSKVKVTVGHALSLSELSLEPKAGQDEYENIAEALRSEVSKLSKMNNV